MNEWKKFQLAEKVMTSEDLIKRVIEGYQKRETVIRRRATVIEENGKRTEVPEIKEDVHVGLECLRALRDYLMDVEDDDFMEAVEYQIRRNLWPYEGDKTAYSWYDIERRAMNIGHDSSDLPQRLYRALAGGKVESNHRTYTSVEAALRDYWTAFPLAIAAGWKPNDAQDYPANRQSGKAPQAGS